MDRYVNICILPDPEFSAVQLMEALFAKLHRCLAKHAVTRVAISFPEVDEGKGHLGSVLRLHGTQRALEELMNEPWLHGMRDHVHAEGIQRVPEQTAHWRVQRVQVKSSPARIRRRHMRRHGWSEAEAQARVPDSVGRTLNLPHIACVSGSTGQRFHLYLRHRPAAAATAGEFNAYGLSPTATVPWF